MDFIDIDDIKTTYSNDEVYEMIKYILSPRFVIRNKPKYNSFDKLYILSFLTKSITDEKLLKNTIGLFEQISFLENISGKLKPLYDILSNNPDYSDLDTIKIKAIAYSISLDCGISLKKFSSFSKNCDIPELSFNVNNRKIEYNLSEITGLIKRKSMGFVRDEIITLPTIKHQETEIKKIIRSMEIIDFDNDTNYFNGEIKHFESIKNNLTHSFETKLNIKNDHIFSNNGFELFEYILETYITAKGKKGRFTDISFYYWKMTEDKFIHRKPEYFKSWFFETYDKEDIGKMKTLLQCNTADKKRDKHYSSALEWFNQ